MSRRADGVYRCDRCGVELENGGVQECAVLTCVVDGEVVVYHFGREEGCEAKVLSKRNLSDHLENAS